MGMWMIAPTAFSDIKVLSVLRLLPDMCLVGTGGHFPSNQRDMLCVKDCV